MLLLLVRHGIAEDLFDAQNDDFSRALTGEGRDKTHRAALGLSRVVRKIDFLATSPRIRAKQTAQILRDVFGAQCAAPKVWDELGAHNLDGDELAGGDFAVLTRKLAALDAQTVAIVGHEPDLGLFAAQLLAGEAFFAMDFKKSGVCAIEVEWAANHAELQFFLPPKILRKLAK